MLEVSGIDTFYGETQALFGASLRVEKGEVVALIGPNGAGKTTLLRSILGLTPARRGSVNFNGEDITRLQTHEIAQRGIGWVPDDRRIFPSLTVRANLKMARKQSAFRDWSLDQIFALFSALEYLMERDCENLSGGEMQMVAISRALLGAPGVVLFDEPSQGLAPKVIQDVMTVIQRIKAEGLAALVVEQNALSALQISDRVYVLRQGEVVHHGDAKTLLERPDERLRLVGM